LIVSLDRLPQNLRTILALLIVIVPIALIAFPVVGGGMMLMSKGGEAQSLRAEIAALQTRIDTQSSANADWFARTGHTYSTLQAFSDPQIAREMLEARLAIVQQVLVEKGANLSQAPVIQAGALEGGVTQLSGEVQFNGPVVAVLGMLEELPFADVTVSRFDISTLPGVNNGRVRGTIVFRQLYIDVDGS
jgi:hypothetical protein